VTDQPVQPAQPAHPAVENISRGLLFAAGSIVLSIVLFALVASFGYFAGIVAAVVPFSAMWLYRKGSGGAFSKAALFPFIGVAAVAILLGVLAGLISRTYAGFSAVGGDGGLFAPAFWSTFFRQLASEDTLFALLIGVGIGGAVLFSVVRQANAAPAQTVAPAPFGDVPNSSAVAAPPAAPSAPATPAVAAPPPPAAPSQGVILNGEPLDPDKKR
jgi:hypothetical protein